MPVEKNAKLHTIWHNKCQIFSKEIERKINRFYDDFVVDKNKTNKKIPHHFSNTYTQQRMRKCMYVLCK